jgi:hypothetical protein
MSSSNPPEDYTVSVQARLTDTWHLEGHLRTGEQVLSFSDDVVAKLPEIVVYWFQFEYNSTRYEFKMLSEQMSILGPNQELVVFINPRDFSRCWVNGYLLHVNVWEPEEED